MKKMVLVLGLMLICGNAYADDEGSLGDRIKSAIGAPVKIAVTVTHKIVHVVRDVSGAAMDITHAALDVLVIPWND